MILTCARVHCSWLWYRGGCNKYNITVDYDCTKDTTVKKRKKKKCKKIWLLHNIISIRIYLPGRLDTRVCTLLRTLWDYNSIINTWYRMHVRVVQRVGIYTRARRTYDFFSAVACARDQCVPRVVFFFFIFISHLIRPCISRTAAPNTPMNNANEPVGRRTRFINHTL